MLCIWPFHIFNFFSIFLFSNLLLGKKQFTNNLLNLFPHLLESEFFVQVSKLSSFFNPDPGGRIPIQVYVVDLHSEKLRKNSILKLCYNFDAGYSNFIVFQKMLQVCVKFIQNFLISETFGRNCHFSLILLVKSKFNWD